MMSNKNLATSIVAVVVVVMLAAVIWPLMDIRGDAADQRILNDFDEISFAVDEYYSETGRLPDTVNDLNLSGDLADRARADYRMTKESSFTYKLCANFNDSKISNFRGEADSNGCLTYELYGTFYDAPFPEESFPSAPFEVDSFLNDQSLPVDAFLDTEAFDLGDFDIEAAEQLLNSAEL